VECGHFGGLGGGTVEKLTLWLTLRTALLQAW
jgi:hypothetical protein